MAGHQPFRIIKEQNISKAEQAKPCTWMPEQRAKFAVFIECFAEQFRTCLLQRQKPWVFWRKLAIFIQTKNPNQCRIFYKKNLTPFRTVEYVTSHLRKNIENFEQLHSFYKNMLINTFKTFNCENTRLVTIPIHVESHIANIGQDKMQHQINQVKCQDLSEVNALECSTGINLTKIHNNGQNVDCTNLHSKQGLESLKAKYSNSVNTFLSTCYNPQHEDNNPQHEDILLKSVIECHLSFLRYIHSLGYLPQNNHQPS